jgi:hypothetical protein
MSEVPSIIDIEASGFGRGSYPIEIGYVLGDGRSGCMLVQPPAAWQHWDGTAEALHHITRDTLLAHGQPVDSVAERLNRELAGLTLYSDGWGNDFTWLSTLYEAAGRTPTFKVVSLLSLLSEDEIPRWDAMKRAVFGAATQARHRASADARLLQETVVRVHEANVASQDRSA